MLRHNQQKCDALIAEEQRQLEEQKKLSQLQKELEEFQAKNFGNLNANKEIEVDETPVCDHGIIEMTGEPEYQFTPAIIEDEKYHLELSQGEMNNIISQEE